MDRIDIKVLDKNFQLIKVEDSFKSLMWCKRYNEVGALDLELSATRENLEIYKEGHYIVRDDDDAVYRIQAAELETTADKNNNLIIGATDVKDILNQRVHYMEETLNTTVENLIRDLIERNVISPAVLSRQIPNFVLGEHRGYDDTISYQLEYDNVGEIISELCKTYQYGYRVLLNENIFVFDLYKGVNRTQFNNVIPPVIFSSSYGNLLSSKYTKDLTKYKNVAVVTGKIKNGDEEQTRLFEVGAAQGLNRYETHVNSSGSSKDLTEQQFTDALAEKGKEALAKVKSTESFEAEISLNQFKYKTDFNLGDVVTVENEFGIYSDARIIEIIETWEDGKYSIEPVFEFGEPVNVVSVEEGTLLTENRMALMSMRSSTSEPITVEQPSDYAKGVKISELEVATSLSEGCCFPVVQGDETRRVTFGTVADSLGLDSMQSDITALKNGFAKKGITLPQGSSIWVLFHKQNYNKDVLVEVCAKLDGGDLQSTFNCRFSGSMYTYKHACVYDYLGFGLAKITVYPVKISNNGKWDGSSAYGVELKNNFTDNNTKTLSIISIKINGVAVDPSNHVSVYSSKPTYIAKGSACTANTANGVIYLN